MLVSKVLSKSKLVRNIRKAYCLPSGERALLAQATGWLAAVEVGLRLLPLRRLMAVLRWGARSNCEPTGVSPPRISRLVEVVAGVYPLRATCLKKALVLYALLSRRGLSVRVVLGMAKYNGEFEAHAWVEYQGTLISSGSGSESYSPLCYLEHATGLGPCS
jgi:transglutaminase-like putative cysteine protease